MKRNAEAALKLLNGIVCLYKPPDCSGAYVETRLKTLICKELNSMEVREAHPYLDVKRSGTEVSIHVRPSYADNVLCSGPRYQPKDMSVLNASSLPFMSSGVYVVGLNGGVKITHILKSVNFTKCYHVKGLFGEVHTDYKVHEKVLARATYDHVERYHMERILASYQISAQKRIMEEYGLDLQSQEAYEFALKGLHRPAKKGATILYGLKVVEFNPPEFTIEVQCIYETPVYLQNLIHNLGLNLKTFAACVGMRCIRYGCFHVDHALLLQQCSYDNILKNLKECWEVLDKNQGGVIKYEGTVQSTASSRQGTLEVKDQSEVST